MSAVGGCVFAWQGVGSDMARAKHYCADCNTHFRASIEQHAETYHDGEFFRGIENGDHQDYLRLRSFDQTSELGR